MLVADEVHLLQGVDVQLPAVHELAGCLGQTIEVRFGGRHLRWGPRLAL